ncbi:MAG: hypothetical protein ACREX3_12715 [Gammaproteobacteria bacterium]
MVAYFLTAITLVTILLLLVSGMTELKAVLRSQRVLRLQQQMVDGLVAFTEKTETGTTAVQRVLAAKTAGLFEIGSRQEDR